MNKFTIGMTIIIIGFIFGCSDLEVKKGRVIFDREAPIHFGVFPFLEEKVLRSALNPFTDFLSKKLERRVEIQIVTDYSDFERLIDQRRVEIGWFTPRSRVFSNGIQMIPICRPKLKAESFYYGLIIARKNSGITCIADLKGKIFAFVDKNSNSGFLYPNRLFKEQNIAPTSFFGGITFSGSHDRSVEGVLDGTYDGAAVTDLVVKKQLLSPSADSSLIVLATTAAILSDPIVVSGELEERLRNQIKEIFLEPGMSESALNAMDSLSKNLGITGFSEIQPFQEEK